MSITELSKSGAYVSVLNHENVDIMNRKPTNEQEYRELYDVLVDLWMTSAHQLQAFVDMHAPAQLINRLIRMKYKRLMKVYRVNQRIKEFKNCRVEQSGSSRGS